MIYAPVFTLTIFQYTLTVLGSETSLYHALAYVPTHVFLASHTLN